MYDTNLSAIEHKLFQATDFVSQRTYRTLTFFGDPWTPGLPTTFLSGVFWTPAVKHWGLFYRSTSYTTPVLYVWFCETSIRGCYCNVCWFTSVDIQNSKYWTSWGFFKHSLVGHLWACLHSAEAANPAKGTAAVLKGTAALPPRRPGCRLYKYNYSNMEGLSFTSTSLPATGFLPMPDIGLAITSV